MTGDLVRLDPQSVIQAERMELSVDEIVAKVAKVREVAAKVMKEDIHYGTIPGTPKPTLYKAGGEILALTFRLAPRYEGERNPIDLGHGHREYVIRCELHHIHSGEFYGSGVGSCSTMETRYRYRPGPVTPTGNPVPKEYWNLRNSDPNKAKALLGGHGYRAKKIDGAWEIVEQGETIENPNPADEYNTVLKMAAKRAYVDAILKATAASEVYTQDLEDKQDDVTPPATGNSPKQNGGANEQAHDPQCPKCGSAVKLIPAGIAKTGKNAGKEYSAFYACQDAKCKHTWRPPAEQKSPDKSSDPTETPADIQRRVQAERAQAKEKKQGTAPVAAPAATYSDSEPDPFTTGELFEREPGSDDQ